MAHGALFALDINNELLHKVDDQYAEYWEGPIDYKDMKCLIQADLYYQCALIDKNNITLYIGEWVGIEKSTPLCGRIIFQAEKLVIDVYLCESIKSEINDTYYSLYIVKQKIPSYLDDYDESTLKQIIKGYVPSKRRVLEHIDENSRLRLSDKRKCKLVKSRTDAEEKQREEIDRATKLAHKKRIADEKFAERVQKYCDDYSSFSDKKLENAWNSIKNKDDGRAKTIAIRALLRERKGIGAISSYHGACPDCLMELGSCICKKQSNNN